MRKTFDKILALALVVTLSLSLLPTTALAADSDCLFLDSIYSDTANPTSVVVNQPFVLQITAYDSDTRWVSGVPVEIGCGDGGLMGTLKGYTASNHPEFFVTTCTFTTPGSKTLTVTSTEGYT